MYWSEKSAQNQNDELLIEICWPKKKCFILHRKFTKLVYEQREIENDQNYFAIEKPSLKETFF